MEHEMEAGVHYAHVYREITHMIVGGGYHFFGPYVINSAGLLGSGLICRRVAGLFWLSSSNWLSQT